MINAKAITDAAQRYFQANPNETIIKSKSQIADVDLRGGTWTTDSTYKTNLFIYQLGGDDGRVDIYRTDGVDTKTYIYHIWQKPDLSGGERLKGCEVGNDDPQTGEQMCKFFLGV